MSVKLTYLSSPGTIDNAIKKVQSAATPPTFNNDFVHSKLQIKGGTGKAITPFFKKIGLVSENGSPTNLYKKLRNTSTSGAAIAQAMRIGYRPLYEVNEYCHELDNKDLTGLILQVTGAEEGSRSADLARQTFLRLKKHANFDADLEESSSEDDESTEDGGSNTGAKNDFRIGYTINLNLPATTNMEVFDAIFQSLRKNLLRDE